MTPAQEAGFVLGKTYEVETRGGFDFEPGDKVVFVQDDSTNMPGFRRTADDSFQYVHLPCMVQPKKSADSQAAVHVSLNGNSTTIVVQRNLTADEVAAVLKAINAA